MATLKFYIRTSKTDKNKLVNIRARFRHGNIDLHGVTGLNVEIEHWNDEKEHVKNTRKATYGYEVNRALRELKTHILEQFAAYTGEFSKDWLSNTIDRYNNPEKYEEKKATLFGYIETYLKNDAETTKRGGYDRVYYMLQQYSEHIGKPIDFNDINMDFYHEFKYYLMHERKLSVNYTLKNIKILRVFLNAAKEDGFNGFEMLKLRRVKSRLKIEEEETDAIYLTDDEIKQLYNFDLSDNPIHEQIRDLFIVGCYTGLRYSDWEKVNAENIQDDQFIVLTQQKTDDIAVIPLDVTVREILNKYNGSLPELGREKINLELKKIGERAKLNEKVIINNPTNGLKKTVVPKHEKISTHTGRRSFATNNYKKGMHIQDIMDVTGHRTKDAFLRYIKATEEEEIKKKKQRITEAYFKPVMKVVNQ